MSLKAIHEKVCNGDPISDDEIKEGIKGFKQLAWLADEAGPVFKLAASEARRVWYQLESFQESRKRG